MTIDYNAMAFPKASWKGEKYKRQKKPANRKNAAERKRVPKRTRIQKVLSVMQPKNDRRCYLCMLLERDYRVHSYLEEHHVLFGTDKWVSDAFGLRVNLCLRHHREGKEAVHNNQDNAELLKRIAQKTFMEAYPDLKWHDYVEKNYLD